MPRFKLSWEISLGSILQLLGMLVAGVWIVATMQASMEANRLDNARLWQAINTMTARLDQHIGAGAGGQ